MKNSFLLSLLAIFCVTGSHSNADGPDVKNGLHAIFGEQGKHSAAPKSEEAIFTEVTGSDLKGVAIYRPSAELSDSIQKDQERGVLEKVGRIEGQLTIRLESPEFKVRRQVVRLPGLAKTRTEARKKCDEFKPAGSWSLPSEEFLKTFFVKYTAPRMMKEFVPLFSREEERLRAFGKEASVRSGYFSEERLIAWVQDEGYTDSQAAMFIKKGLRGGDRVEKITPAGYVALFEKYGSFPLSEAEMLAHAKGYLEEGIRFAPRANIAREKAKLASFLQGKGEEYENAKANAKKNKELLDEMTKAAVDGLPVLCTQTSSF